MRLFLYCPNMRLQYHVLTVSCIMHYEINWNLTTRLPSPLTESSTRPAAGTKKQWTTKDKSRHYPHPPPHTHTQPPLFVHIYPDPNYLFDVFCLSLFYCWPSLAPVLLLISIPEESWMLRNDHIDSQGRCVA